MVAPPDVLVGKVHTSEHENCGRHNVSKHRDIKDGKKYITLDISLNFVILDKMGITSSEPKDYLVRSGKGLIISMGIKHIIRSNKDKKFKVCH